MSGKKNNYKYLVRDLCVGDIIEFSGSDFAVVIAKFIDNDETIGMVYLSFESMKIEESYYTRQEKLTHNERILNDS